MGWKKKHWFSYPHQLVGHCWPNGSGDFKVKKSAKNISFFLFHFFDFFNKKNLKNGSNSSLLLTTICDFSCVISSLNIEPYWQRIPENPKKLATIGQKRLQNYAHPAIASKYSANNPRTYYQITWDEKNSVSAIRTNWLITVGPTVQEIQHF